MWDCMVQFRQRKVDRTKRDPALGRDALDAPTCATKGSPMKLLFSMLLFATVGYGQQPSKHEPLCAVLNADGIGHSCTEQPKPLKCGKWERSTLSDDLQPANPDGRRFCAPIMHPLTEKEWQELNQELDAHADVIHALKTYIKANQLYADSVEKRLKALEAKGQRLERLEK